MMSARFPRLLAFSILPALLWGLGVAALADWFGISRWILLPPCIVSYLFGASYHWRWSKIDDPKEQHNG